MQSFESLPDSSKKTRKTKQGVKKELEESIINGELNENKDLKAKSKNGKIRQN